LPSNPGIYLFLDEKGNVLYVGKAKNLKKRVASYFVNRTDLGEKTKQLIERTRAIKTVKTHSEIEALLLEASYIKKYNPAYNSRLTDGKAYPLIKITIEDKYPKILVVRRPDDNKSIYFGPYPNSGAMKLVLKTVRRIFPYVSVKTHPKKVCLYYHLKLCPCPAVFDSPELRRDYKTNIRRIIKFLEGKSKKVIKDLEIERCGESKKENFEKAQKIQKQIDSINIVINSSYKLFEEEINTNLKDDLRDEESQELAKHLKNTTSQVGNLRLIECFDISNISGKFAVGSMVVFINGEKNTSSYRRFKIRFTKEEPNDYAMISEVVSRRLNHEEWPLPDLIIVDGGKGQVSSVVKVLKKKNLKIALIGLAKREETIITSDLKEIRLPKDSKALLLVMRIRDEAHRFAITYHRNLRSKSLTNS